ncbi:MAG: acyloxyacyl hydrolase [Prevotella sp.]|nr:acyloxyacyl hydrolase [Prevotella sp.]
MSLNPPIRLKNCLKEVQEYRSSRSSDNSSPTHKANVCTPELLLNDYSYLHFFLLLFFIFGHSSAQAEGRDSTRHYGFQVNVGTGKYINIDQYTKKFVKPKASHIIGMEVNHSALPCDSNAFDSDYNYPNLSFGLRYHVNDVTMHRSPDPDWGLAEEVDYDSRLGNAVTLYSTFTRPLYRDHSWMFDYSLGSGVGWCMKKYDKNDNIDDEIIGSHLNVYFTAGLHATYRIARDWGLMGGVEFFHHSNGALARPNKGANFISPIVGVKYMPFYGKMEDRSKNRIRQPFSPYWYANITLGVGGKTLLEDWQDTQFMTSPDSADYRTEKFRFYMAYSAKADIMYRYARRWASGIGIDLFYGTYASHIKELDRKAGYDICHSPYSLGLSFKHHVFYHNLSAAMALGYYLYREMGHHAKIIEKPYYEQIGIRYTFPQWKELTIGFNINAHLTKADFTEIVIAYPIHL